jgi:hypothetical protein
MKKKSNVGSKTTAQTPSDNVCGYCGRAFARQQSLEVHICEQKRRDRERNDRGVQIGYQAFIRFYETTQGSAKLKTWEDFVRSPYYKAFVKFGRYCQGTRVIGSEQYLEWLLANNKRLDNWCKDSLYDEFLLQYLRQEMPEPAIRRALDAADRWNTVTGNPPKDYLRYGNTNEICVAIVGGRISAWVLYNTGAGMNFLESLDAGQINMIWPYIDSEYWQRRFASCSAERAYVESYFQELGW